MSETGIKYGPLVAPPDVIPSLCIFLVSGRTFTFRSVTIEHDNESAITFTYEAMSDGRRKRATFIKLHVAGVSRTT